MKLKLDKDIFLDKLSKAIKFIPSQSVVPALQNFKLTVIGNEMEIIAQDNHIQIKVYCPIMKSDGDMSFCLPAKLLFHTVNLFRENEVLITIKDEKKIELKNGKSKYNISPDTLPENFPVMEMKESVSEISMHQFYLKLALRSTERFIDDTSIMFNAEGINVAEIDNKIIFTGISGQNTMCRVSVKPMSIAKWDSVVIPSEFASKIVGMLEDKGDISICNNANRVMFFTTGDDRYEIMSVIKECKYPNSESLLKLRPSDYVTINSAEFKDAVKRLKLFTSDLDSVKKVKIISNPENNNEIIMQAIDNFKGKDGEEILTISNIEGVAVNKTFNANWLLEILGVFEESEFYLYHSNDAKIPCCIYPKPEGEEESNFSFIISQFND